MPAHLHYQPNCLSKSHVSLMTFGLLTTLALASSAFAAPSGLPKSSNDRPHVHSGQPKTTIAQNGGWSYERHRQPAEQKTQDNRWSGDRSIDVEALPDLQPNPPSDAARAPLGFETTTRTMSPSTGTGLWTGTTALRVEKLIASLKLPPHSPTLHTLWVRAMTANAAPAQSEQGAMPFTAVQSEALYRSGLLADAHAVMRSQAPDSQSATPLLTALVARAALATGAMREGCEAAKTLVRQLGQLPKTLVGTTTLMVGLCAVQDRNKAAAGLAADLATDHGLKTSAGVAVLRAYSVGGEPHVAANATLSVIGFRIVEAVGGRIDRPQLAKASPPLLAAIATSRTVSHDLRVFSGEAALAQNAISPRDMTDIYRAVRSGSRVVATLDRDGGGQNFGNESQRAALFNAAEQEQSPLRKARNIRAYVDSARKAGLSWHALALMAGPANQMALVPEISWFAETGIEVSLAAGDYESARRWATFGAANQHQSRTNLDHWRGLIDIADPGVNKARLGNGLTLIEATARRGLFAPEDLHRLATVLDALDTQVPIPLWELASRTPQPTTGHLPETGVLSDLQNAAKERQIGLLTLLVMQTLGPTGTDGAHMIALGDSIRALKRAGLKADSRRLGLEALMARWPRAAAY